MNLTVEHFTAEDGDQWFSVVLDGELATGVMHATLEEADAERLELQQAPA